MTRARPAQRVLALLTVMAALLTVLIGVPAPASARDVLADPAHALSVQITSLSPSAIPSKGPIVIKGVVANNGTQPWQAVQAFPLTSYDPMTTRAELAAAAQTPDTTEFGQRLLGRFVGVGDLPPGASTTFTLKVPRKSLDITGAPGVYWIGVQVLGTNATGRDNVADGRARTFIPLVPQKPRLKVHGRVAFVVPVRARVQYAADGTLADATSLAHSLAPDGRLGHLAAFGLRAAGHPVTWLVDPAVIAAAQAIVDDNPGLDLALATPGQRRSATPSPSPQGPVPQGNGAPPQPLTNTDRTNARDWLTTMTTLMHTGQVLALPYGDPDVSALGRSHAELLTQARSMSSALFRSRKIVTTPAIAPVDGYLDPAVVPTLPPSTTLLLADHGHPAGRASIGTSGGLRYVAIDSRTSGGGPDPAPHLTPLPLRQRILSDAALQALSGSSRALVVSPPADWDPGPDSGLAGFFQGLSQPWLSLVGLSGGVPVARPALRFPTAARKAEIPRRNAAAAAQLAHTGSVVGQLVDNGQATAQQLTAAALGAVSYQARDHSRHARQRANQLSSAITTLLDAVKVVGSDFVTLSGGSGALTVAMVNGLNRDVTLRVSAHGGGSDVHIASSSPVKLAAGQRSTVRLHADAHGIGVHEVRLVATTSGGHPVGTPLVFSLRTSQIGKVFWAVLIGLAVLFGLLLLRRVGQRIRSDGWRT